jgi:CheY-like chemotaxis protein
MNAGLRGKPSMPRTPGQEIVLVVDDDPDIRESLAVVLQGEGYDAALASNGQEALGLLSRGELGPAAILLDLTMPVMDGWEFLAHKQRDPRLWAIPVIVMTASGRRAEDGATLHLDKPFGVDALVCAVHQCIRSR